MLKPTESNGVTGVQDTDGGVWWPSEEAQSEIEAASDPAAAAVAMCEAEPSRGEWSC